MRKVTVGAKSEGHPVSRRSRFLALFATLSTAAAIVFLAISIDPDVYAPGAQTLEQHLPGSSALHHVKRRVAPGLDRALSARTILRKLYSVIAFAIVGFFAAPLLARPSRLRTDAAVVAVFSLIIEIAQKLAGSNEGLGSNFFDVACGAIGGLVGALAWNALLRRPGVGPLRED